MFLGGTDLGPHEGDLGVHDDEFLKFGVSDPDLTVTLRSGQQIFRSAPMGEIVTVIELPYGDSPPLRFTNYFPYHPAPFTGIPLRTQCR